MSFPDRQGTDLVVVGDCNPDALVLGDDVTRPLASRKSWEGIWMVVGGSAAITAAAAARLGLSVRLVTAIGGDPAGDFLLDQLPGKAWTPLPWPCATVYRPA